ncbi:putative mitochondrial protein, partial [Tanacetum coccineum]
IPHNNLTDFESDREETANQFTCNYGEAASYPDEGPRSKGVSMEEEKISGVKSWPIPSTVKEVRGFLGLTDYYRFSKPFVIEYDASSDGVGAIPSQEDHPVAYFSKGFSPSNRFKSAYDRELFALVLAVANIKAGLQTDSFTSELIMKLQIGPSYQLLFHHGWMVIPEIHNLKLKLLQEAHDTLIDGHGEEATWDIYDLVADQFPTFRLEDKTFYEEGSNDKEPPLKVYSRRKDRVTAAKVGQSGAAVFYLWKLAKSTRSKQLMVNGLNLLKSITKVLGSNYHT